MSSVYSRRVSVANFGRSRVDDGLALNLVPQASLKATSDMPREIVDELCRPVIDLAEELPWARQYESLASLVSWILLVSLLLLMR
jgi:hypothetical protein